MTRSPLRARVRRIGAGVLAAALLPLMHLPAGAADFGGNGDGAGLGDAAKAPEPLDFDTSDPWSQSLAQQRQPDADGLASADGLTAADGLPAVPGPSSSGETGDIGSTVDAAEADELWQSAFAGPGLDATPYAATVWDDGSGPALYVAGEFLTAGEHRVNGVARWDGSEWTPLTGSSSAQAPETTGVSGWTSSPPTRVLAMTVYDGDLIVGGNFTEAGGQTVNNIARWDGTGWSALESADGPGVDAQVQALTVHEGELIAGGLFRRAGGDPAANWVAAWDGDDWSGLTGTTPSGLDGNLSGTVRALSVYDGELVAAGGFVAIAHWDGFDWIDRVQAGGIARWDGEQWHTLTAPSGTGTDGYVNALQVAHGELYVGGSFAEAGAMRVGRIARWDGSEWAKLPGPDGTAFDNAVYTLAEYDGDLIAGGSFSAVGGTDAALVARWDGSAWSALEGSGGDGVGGNAIQTLAMFDGRLFTGGRFDTADGSFVNSLATWDGNDWSMLGSSSGILGNVQAATVYQGDLIVGGRFEQAGDVAAKNIARWDGNSWAPLGEGINNDVSELVVYQGRLVASGGFTEAGDAPVDRIAAWDGTEWSPLGSGVSGGLSPRVHALHVREGKLFVGGDFDEAGTVQASNIASWDGSEWSPVGAGVGGDVNALADYDGELVAAGRFRQAGETRVNRIARWDGTGWSPLAGSSGVGVSLLINDLTVYEDRLVVGGSFNQAGGVPAENIAAWDGSEWFPLGPGIDNFGVSALTAYDGAVIAGGAFTHVGGEAMTRIASWDGEGWSPLSGPLAEGMDGRESGSSVLALEAFEDGPEPVAGNLLAGGTFLMSGGVANWAMGVYGPEQVGEPDIELTADTYAYEEDGTWYADFSWTGATASEVDLYRDFELVGTVPNSGAHTDELGQPRRGSVFLYQVCHAGSDVCSNVARVRVSPRRPPEEPGLAVTTEQLPALNVLERYEVSLAAEGGTPPYTWSATGLPEGLVVDAETGVLSNDPADPAITGTGGSTVTLKAEDSAGDTAEAELSLDVVGVEAIVAGDSHTCGLTTEQTVYCWGRNSSGELGGGSATSDPSLLPQPVSDPGDPAQVLGGVTALAAGEYHTCALTTEQTLLCWGYNGAGQLGNGDDGLEPIPTPSPVVDPENPDTALGGITGVSAGVTHTCATSSDGTAWCWGGNYYGQLGDDTVLDKSLPVQVVDPADVNSPMAGLTQITAGNLHTCARTDTGEVHCWGWNIGGQLGNGAPSPGPTKVPTAVVDPDDPETVLGDIAGLSAGNIHTCAVTSAGDAYCWGQNTYGQLGNGGEPGNVAVPSAVVDPSGDGSPLSGVASVTAGGLHGCAALADASAVCWGLNDHGQLGNGENDDTNVPVVVAGPDGSGSPLSDVAEVSVDGWRSCATTFQGLASCWGGNASGQLGDGSTEDRPVPAPVRPG